MEGFIPPIIWQYPPQYFHVPKLGISERDDLCFGLHFILGKKLGIWERYDLFLFWSSLHFGIVGILVVWKVRAKGCVAKSSAATVSGNVEL